MKTKFAGEIRDRLEEKRGEAREKWDGFAKMRDEAPADVATADPEQWKAIVDSHREYATIDEEVKSLESALVEALGIDGDGPKSRGTAEERLNAAGVWTPGDRLTDSDVYKSLRESGVLAKSKSRVEMTPVEVVGRDEFKQFIGGGGFEQKAPITGLSDTSAGSFVRNDRMSAYFPGLNAPLSLTDLVTVGSTDSDIVEWVEETGFTNAAAEIAEATATAGASGTKPESALAYAVVQSAVRTLAHWIPATKRALSDVPMLRTLVDARLRDGLNLRLEAQIVNGNGVGENLLGILNTPGIGSIAVGIAPDNALEAILRAITAIRLAFMEPTAVLIHPNDWMQIRLMRDLSGGANTGQYLYGPPAFAGAMTIWGLPMIPTVSVPEGNPLVGKFNEAMLWIREGITVSATDSHADFFIRNLVAILAEMRVAFGVPRPEAFAEVTGA